MKFFVKYLFSKFSKFFSNFFSKFPADLVTFTEDIHNGKLHFLCIVEYTVNINVTEYFNPFVHNAPFFYPLKTSENLTISRRGLINLSTPFFLISTLTKTIKKTYLLFWRLMKNDSNNLYFHPCRTHWNKKFRELRPVFWCFQGVEKGCIGSEWANSWQWTYYDKNWVCNLYP